LTYGIPGYGNCGTAVIAGETLQIACHSALLNGLNAQSMEFISMDESFPGIA
jgi:hypothetical protein